jgi:hypothetical protein
VPSQVIMSVAEIPCEDPACPGPATQIIVLGLEMVPRIVMIHRPVANINAGNMVAAFSDARSVTGRAHWHQWTTPLPPATAML